MKNIVSSFILGVGTGAIVIYLYLIQPKWKTTDLDVKITQETGNPIRIISSEIDKKNTLTTTLYSEPTGTVSLSHKIPHQKSINFRIGVMPSYSGNHGFGIGALLGIEYNYGRIGYFLDGFYDPIQQEGGVALGISFKINI